MNFALIFIIILFSLFLYPHKGGKNKVLVFLLLLCITLIISIRDIKVPDTDGYIESYLYDADIFDFANSQYEKGYTIFMRFSRLFLGDFYIAYFALFPVINFCLLSKSCNNICGKFLKETTSYDGNGSSIYNPFILFISYFSFFGLYHNAIVLRAGIATSLVMLSMSFLIRHKSRYDIFKSLTALIIAFFFHSSTLVCIPLLYIAYKGFNYNMERNRVWLIVILLVYIISPVLDIVMNPLNQAFLLISNSENIDFSKFEYYNNTSTYSNTGISFKFLFFYSAAWLFSTCKNTNLVWKKLLFSYFLGLLLWAIFRTVLWVERITDFYIFLYVFMSMILVKQNINRITTRIVFFMSSVVQLFFIYRIIYS